MGFFSNLFSRKKAAFAVDNYEAAAFTRDRSAIYPSSVDQSVNPSVYTRSEILRISRYLVNNFPLAERILTVAEIYGIGAGLIANASTSDHTFNAAASAAFDRWAGSVFCSSNNHYNLYEMQKLLVRELIIAGEVFIVLEKAGTGYPQLHLVPSEDVRHSGEQSDNSIDGLYLDDYGRVVAYNVFTGKVWQKIDAANVVHIVRHKQIGQLRGIGSFAASLNSMRDHKDCMALEKKAIKVHSQIALVVEKEGGEAPNGLLGGDDIRLDDAGSPTSVPSNRRLETPFGGAAIVLDKGEKANLVAGERSTEGFVKFLEMLVRDVCLNISLPYEFLVNPEKLNGTAVRFALSDAAAFFRDIQDRILDGGMQRIYAWVISSFIKDGKVAAPAQDLPFAVSWTRPLSITVDSQRVTNAEIALLQNSLLTYESFYSARGKDWREELRQHAIEEQYLDQLSQETGVSITRLRALQAGSPTIEQKQEQEA